MRRVKHFLAGLALLISGPVLAGPGIDNDLALLDVQAKAGEPKAQTELAIKYEYAEGVPQDLERARHLFCEAAKQGYAEAEFQLGWLYANGRGVEHDDGVAATLFEQAANQGHEYARKMLRYVRAGSNVELPQCLQEKLANEAASEDSVTATGNRGQIEALVHRLAPQYGVDPKLALAVISAESGFDSQAVSPKNAKGLMQLVPQTAERFRVKRILDPVQNVRGGLAYLRWLLAYFRGNVVLVLAAYNAGERAVERYRGIPPFAETRDYVRKITRTYKKVNVSFDANVTGPSPLMRENGPYAER